MYTDKFERLSEVEVKDLANEFLTFPAPVGFPKKGTREHYLLQFALWYGDRKMKNED